jgi:hypothetical protein
MMVTPGDLGAKSTYPLEALTTVRTPLRICIGNMLLIPNSWRAADRRKTR